MSFGWNRSGGNGEASIVWGSPASTYKFEICSFVSSTITPRLTIDTSGNVGIGTTSPVAPFVVSNGGGIGMETLVTVLPDASAGSYIQTYNRATSAFVTMGFNASQYRWYNTNSEVMRITSGGNVLIGTATDATGKLQVNGTVYATGFYESSDIRLKTILEKNPIVDLKGIEVIKFTRNDSDINQVRYGYSAQEVQSICSDLVSGNDFLNVNYIDVHTLKIAALEQEIKELKTLLNEK